MDDVDKILSFYAPQVDYFDQGIVGHDFIRRDVAEYGNQWTARRGELVVPVLVSDGTPGREWTAQVRSFFYRENADHTEWIRGEIEQTYRFSLIDDAYKISSIRAKILQRTMGKLNASSSPAGPSSSTAAQPGASEVEILNAMVRSSLDAASRGNIGRIVSEYAPSVDYFDEGMKTPNQIREDLRAYFARWPAQQLRLQTPVTIGQVENGDRRLSFGLDFAAYNPSTRKSIHGSADVIWIVRPDSGSTFKIVSQKEKILTRRNQTAPATKSPSSAQRPSSRTTRSSNQQAPPPPMMPDVVRGILEQLLKH